MNMSGYAHYLINCFAYRLNVIIHLGMIGFDGAG